MSNALKYQDLSHTERLEYERIVGQGQSSGKSTQCYGEPTHDTSQPARRRPFLAAAKSLGSYVASLFQRARLVRLDTGRLGKWFYLGRKIGKTVSIKALAATVCGLHPDELL